MIANSFNHLAYDFINDLSEAFPKEALFKECLKHFDIEKTDAVQIMNYILGDKTHLVTSKDETLFELIQIPTIDVKALWDSISEEFKPSIWQRLNSLVLVANTMNNTPPEIMSGIEDLAMELGEKLQKGELDMGNIMGEVFQRVQKMDLSALQNMDMDVNALTSSLGMNTEDLSNMMGEMLGGVNPDIMKTMSSLMTSQEDETDILSILESARPPPQVPRREQRRSQHSERKSSKKKHSRK